MIYIIKFQKTQWELRTQKPVHNASLQSLIILRAVEGSEAQTECAADVDPKLVGQTSITWLKDNLSIATEKNLSGLLRFNNLKRSDEGVYSCQIENVLEKKIIQLRLEVEPKIGVVLTSQHHEYFEQENITLECNGGNAENKLSLSWYKDDVLIETESQSNLTITNASLEDEGSYKCLIKSDIDEAESSLTVKMLRKARLIGEGKMPIAATGTSLNISCKASVEPSLITSLIWTWTKDNNPLEQELAIQKQVRGKSNAIFL